MHKGYFYRNEQCRSRQREGQLSGRRDECMHTADDVWGVLRLKKRERKEETFLHKKRDKSCQGFLPYVSQNPAKCIEIVFFCLLFL